MNVSIFTFNKLFSGCFKKDQVEEPIKTEDLATQIIVKPIKLNIDYDDVIEIKELNKRLLENNACKINILLARIMNIANVKLGWIIKICETQNVLAGSIGINMAQRVRCAILYDNLPIYHDDKIIGILCLGNSSKIPIIQENTYLENVIDILGECLFNGDVCLCKNK